MCRKCLKEDSPDRGTSTLEGGSYLLNFKGCGGCGELSIPKIINKKREEKDEVETVKYTHICGSCQHVIGDHFWQFKIEGKYQLFEMNCTLCGNGEAEVSIDPEDPRRMQSLDM